MAQNTRVIITDDIDGSEGASSYTFAWQGTSYEIDLNDKHRDQFLKALAPYIDAGRMVRKSGGTKGSRMASAARGESAAEIREWAKANGWPDLSERGRIPSEARKAFFVAQGK